MNAAVCACGRRLESEGTYSGGPSTSYLMSALRTETHDPDECSRQVGFQGRFDGRREMALAAVDHLIERQTLDGKEVAEIRTNLLDLVTSLPLAPVRSSV
jgi:hypothetical protein